MDVRVCKKCRRLFKYFYGPELCSDCIGQAPIKEEAKGNVLLGAKKPLGDGEIDIFEKVRDYIIANPKATVAQIAEANDIPPSKLFEWIREERLEFSNESTNAWFTCEKCGRQIKSGRLCNRCK